MVVVVVVVVVVVEVTDTASAVGASSVDEFSWANAVIPVAATSATRHINRIFLSRVGTISGSEQSKNSTFLLGVC